MYQQLPKKIDPFRYAQNGSKLVGKLQASNMSRLSSALNDKEDIVSVDMLFDVDEEGTPYLSGKFTSPLTLICERCMNKMLLTVKTECLLALIRNEHKIESIAEQYEPWIINGNKLVELSSIVEDELILALPLVPRHNFNCSFADI